MSNRTLNIDDALYTYLCENSLREPPVMRRLREVTASLDEAAMQISPEQAQLMALLARLIGAKLYLEIGVFTGYSSLAVALALPEDGRVIACDINPQWTRIAQRYWQEAGVAHKVELRLAPAADSAVMVCAIEPSAAARMGPPSCPREKANKASRTSLPPRAMT